MNVCVTSRKYGTSYHELLGCHRHLVEQLTKPYRLTSLQLQFQIGEPDVRVYDEHDERERRGRADDDGDAGEAATGAGEDGAAAAQGPVAVEDLRLGPGAGGAVSLFPARRDVQSVSIRTSPPKKSLTSSS